MVAGLIHDIPTCEELIARIIAEAQAIIRIRLEGRQTWTHCRNCSKPLKTASPH
jgi:hypothetical protein